MKCPRCGSNKVQAQGFQKGTFKTSYTECLDCGRTARVVK